MNTANLHLRHIAKRLIVFESIGKTPNPAKPRPVLPFLEEFRPHLATLMGDGGYHALLSRSLALAKTEVPWLRPVQVNADGSLQGLEELQSQLGPDEFLEGRIVLLARLLGLLTAFIGENLMLSLVGEVRPKVPLDNLDFAEGDKK